MQNFTNIAINSNSYNKMIDYILDLVKNSNILLLYGKLGTGKTFLTQQLIAKISYEIVVSPTFSLLNTYNTNIGEVYHYDLYRIKHIDELINLNIEQALNSRLVIVEWPQIAEDLWKKYFSKVVSINIEYSLNGRNYIIDNNFI